MGHLGVGLRRRFDFYLPTARRIAIRVPGAAYLCRTGGIKTERAEVPGGRGDPVLPIFPREHGAWGMLLIPLGTAAGVAGRWDVPLTLFLAAVLALFLLRVPAETLFHSSPLRRGDQLRR